MFNISKQTVQFGAHTLTLETGGMARQANGAVKVTMGDTVLLATAVGIQSDTPRDFLPLTVNYQERAYCTGKIPGGYFKREGRPTERETLTSRLIDRPLRPLFPKGFCSEVQVVLTLISMDENVSPDVPAMIGASAALSISGIPFDGPIGCARIGFRDGEYILNPSFTDVETSQLDLMLAAKKDAVLMVESEAKELTEEQMLGAIKFGHEKMQPVIDAIEALKKEAGKPRWEWEAPAQDEALVAKVTSLAQDKLVQAYTEKEKLLRKKNINAVFAEVTEQLCTVEEGQAPDTGISKNDVEKILSKLEKNIVRQQILDGKPRIDGRDTKTVRPIDIQVGVLPRTHGSALFTRGETQALVVTTLGTERDAQKIDYPEGDHREEFMLHYNFPAYSVGEVGFMGSPKRREIGHGRLARRALEAVVPKMDEFPYSLRAVSEITESNGSSSMATVCGTSLALMDAGVPVKAPVAGIAMGLIKEEEKFAVLTDILGDEDHLGDMDFKVAGTETGITALQMDIKIQGITPEIMDIALVQAKDARLHILGLMNGVMKTSRSDISQYAPRILTIQINPDKIRDVIGKGGATIRAITEQTGTTIDLTDDGVVKIASVDGAAAEKAREWVEGIVADVEVGTTYDGVVEKILEFGAIVSFMRDKTGLVHISQISDEHVDKVTDYLTEGEEIRVKVLDVDRQGKVKLSMKAAAAA